jgi:hypothetical protein
MGLSETVVNWLEGDPSNSFFEFKIALDERTEEYVCTLQQSSYLSLFNPEQN